MRWTEEDKPNKPRPPRPKIGDEKIEVKFAWTPVAITRRDNVWLEKYEIVYEYKEVTRPVYNYMTYEDGTLCKGLSKIPTGEYSTSNEWVQIRKQYKSDEMEKESEKSKTN
jgi:hypothetical protein